MKSPSLFEIDNNNSAILENPTGAKFLKYEIAKRQLYLNTKDRYELFEYACNEFIKYRKNYKEYRRYLSLYNDYLEDYFNKEKGLCLKLNIPENSLDNLSDEKKRKDLCLKLNIPENSLEDFSDKDKKEYLCLKLNIHKEDLIYLFDKNTELHLRLDEDLLRHFNRTNEKESFCKKINADIKIVQKILDISQKYGYVATCLLLGRDTNTEKHYLLNFLQFNQEVYWKKEIESAQKKNISDLLKDSNEGYVLCVNNSIQHGVPFPSKDGYIHGIFCNTRFHDKDLDINIPINTLRNISNEQQITRYLKELEMHLRDAISSASHKNIHHARQEASILLHKIIDLSPYMDDPRIIQNINNLIQKKAELRNKERTTEIQGKNFQIYPKSIVSLYKTVDGLLKNNKSKKDLSLLLENFINKKIEKNIFKSQQEAVDFLYKEISLLSDNEGEPIPLETEILLHQSMRILLQDKSPKTNKLIQKLKDMSVFSKSCENQQEISELFKGCINQLLKDKICQNRHEIEQFLHKRINFLLYDDYSRENQKTVKNLLQQMETLCKRYYLSQDNVDILVDEFIALILDEDKEEEDKEKINSELQKKIILLLKKEFYSPEQKINIFFREKIKNSLDNDGRKVNKRALSNLNNRIDILCENAYSTYTEIFNHHSIRDQLEIGIHYGFGNSNSSTKGILSLIIWDAKILHKKQFPDIHKEINDVLKKIRGVAELSDKKIYSIYTWIDNCIKDNHLYTFS